MFERNPWRGGGGGGEEEEEGRRRNLSYLITGVWNYQASH
jgi:hypothetical protein